jgi:hypothetical protein
MDVDRVQRRAIRFIYFTILGGFHYGKGSDKKSENLI